MIGIKPKYLSMGWFYGGKVSHVHTPPSFFEMIPKLDLKPEAPPFL
jgi:hypothetical protein